MPLRFDYDFLVIGSGPAGQRSAVAAAKKGFRTAIIEKRQVVGGNCIGVGTIPSKTFREAILALVRTIGSANDVDGPVCLKTRPKVDELVAQVSRVVARELEVIESQLKRNGIIVLYGKAIFEDSHTLRIDSPDDVRRVTAKHIVIAVGSEPAKPEGIELDGEVILSSDHILKLTEIPQSLTVVGGGVIGVEYASMFAMLGTEVHLTERKSRLLDFLDWEIADELVDQMTRNNVTFHFNETVQQIRRNREPEQGVATLLESQKRIDSDMVLYAIGRQGTSKELGLEAAGLKADKRGRIQVDERFCTSVPHIHAAGDIIGFPALAATSSEQGRLAACHALGIPAGPKPENFPVGIYAIPEISTVGLSEHELTAAKVPYVVGLARYREIARGQILGDYSGLFKILFHRENRRLLGVHAIGTGATELIHIGQAVLRLEGGLDYFLQTVFNYPTLAECYKVAALDAANKLAR